MRRALAYLLAGLAGVGGGVPGLAGALLGARIRRSRSLGLLVAGWMVVTVVIVVSQTRFGHQPTLDWPGRFTGLAPVTWFVVSLAGVAAMASRD